MSFCQKCARISIVYWEKKVSVFSLGAYGKLYLVPLSFYHLPILKATKTMCYSNTMGHQNHLHGFNTVGHQNHSHGINPIGYQIKTYLHGFNTMGHQNHPHGFTLIGNQNQNLILTGHPYLDCRFPNYWVIRWT